MISLFVFILAPQLISIFSPGQKDVINTGATYLRIEGIFYVLIGYLFIFYGFFRGMGNFKTSIVLTIISLGVRVGLSFGLVGLGFGLTSIWWSIPVGWLLADIAGFIFYKLFFKDRYITPIKSS